MKDYRFSKLLIVFFTGFVIIISIAFIFKDQKQYIYNVFLAYILVLIFFYYEKKKDLNISKHSKILVMLTLLLHFLFGQYYDLYILSRVFDKVLHILGAFGISLFLYELLISIIYPVNMPKSRLLILVLIVSMGITLGTFFEIFEFIIDKIFDANNQKSLKDTNLDLIFNVFGATIASIKVIGQLKK